jgi:hypothetical protein
MAASSQATAVLVGIAILYRCTSGSPYIERPLWNAVYWGVIGPPGVMFLGSHITVLVLLPLSLAIIIGLRWPRGYFLLPTAAIMWAVWWVAVAYAMCFMSD